MIKGKENPDADVSALETEIDRLVYQLYDLTDDEVKIVEGGRENEQGKRTERT